MLLGVAGRRPKYWWDLGQSIDSDLGGLLGTHVRNSNGLYTNPNTGLITTVGNNIPRFERQGGLLALLDEPAGTNLIHFSHELGNVASGWWTDVNLTSVTANGMLAPDGTMAADGMVANINDVTHRLQTGLISGITQDDKVALIVFAKPGNKDWINIQVGYYDAGDISTGDYGICYFNVSSGVVGAEQTSAGCTIHSTLIEEAANGFYRVGIIVSNDDITTAKMNLSLRSAHADADDTFPGNTTDVNTWFWGADLKKQTYFDSYVPTSGGTVTRATESGYPLWDLPLGLFDSEGLASVWVRFGYARTDLPLNQKSGVINVTDAQLGLLINRESAGSGLFRSQDGTNQASSTSIDFAANTWYKPVVKWSSTTSKMRVGYDSGVGIVWGLEVAFDGSYTLGASLRLAFGLFGPLWLRDLRLYDRIPSDSEINSMGSP